MTVAFGIVNTGLVTIAPRDPEGIGSGSPKAQDVAVGEDGVAVALALH